MYCYFNTHCCFIRDIYLDEVAKQNVALSILGKCFAVRDGKDNLPYFFEEYDVLFINNLSLYYHLYNYRKPQSRMKFCTRNTLNLE